MKSSLETKFAFLWRALNGPKLEPEFKFHETRKWRFDFAHPQTRTAIEIEGGVWNGGRHTRGRGYEADCLKYSVAALMGWKVVRVTPRMVNDGTATALLIAAIKNDVSVLRFVGSKTVALDTNKATL